MSSSPIEVHIEIGERTALAGTLYFHSRRVERSTFKYSAEYLAAADAYSIEPSLPLSAGAFQSAGKTFSVFADAAPDRWGRILIERRMRQMARAAGKRTQPTVLESDYVLGVNDLTRQGAIRFKLAGEDEFSATPDRAVPTAVSLPELLHAADQVTDDDDAALKTLLDAGSASLGGARPKTAVRDEHGLLLAKFPHASDEWDVMAWEKTAMDIAEVAKISVPWRRLEHVGSRHVLLIRRFDRRGERRVGYMSARTMLESRDDEADYSELAEALELLTEEATVDLQEFWRRILFSILINNTDDHLRNHGLVRSRRGWRLSPVFDINPNPDSGKKRVTGILGETRGEAQLDALREIGELFRVEQRDRKQIEIEVREAVSQWPTYATRNGLAEKEKDRMSAAFDLAEML
jgi:serine/threonine-protein kinase HipA